MAVEEAEVFVPEQFEFGVGGALSQRVKYLGLFRVRTRASKNNS